jgi:hypothetical protein
VAKVAFQPSLNLFFADLAKTVKAKYASGWVRIKLIFDGSHSFTTEIEKWSAATENYTQVDAQELKEIPHKDLELLPCFWKPADYSKRMQASGGKEGLFVGKNKLVLNATMAAVVWGNMDAGGPREIFSSVPRLGVLESTTLIAMQQELSLSYRMANIEELISADFVCLVSCIRGFRPGFLRSSQIGVSVKAANHIQRRWLQTLART